MTLRRENQTNINKIKALEGELAIERNKISPLEGKIFVESNVPNSKIVSL